MCGMVKKQGHLKVYNMKETLNSMIKEQFGIGKVPEKLWYVMTQYLRNIANVPVENGRFHPAILLEGTTATQKLMRYLLSNGVTIVLYTLLLKL